ncbi:E2F transcription factor 3 [Salvia divinorum]|uniref:E2F transcription factor 3 n=1 Tax=Salvia divinorum TaxID=28513 RepID=A0ABD1GKY3_SALDI
MADLWKKDCNLLSIVIWNNINILHDELEMAAISTPRAHIPSSIDTDVHLVNNDVQPRHFKLLAMNLMNCRRDCAREKRDGIALGAKWISTSINRKILIQCPHNSSSRLHSRRALNDGRRSDKTMKRTHGSVGERHASASSYQAHTSPGTTDSPHL